MKQTAYKLVLEKDGKLVSLVNRNPTKAYRKDGRWYIPSRVYRVGHITRAHPNGLGIFCTSSITKDAMWWNTIPHYNLLEVEGLGRPTMYPLRDYDYVNPSRHPGEVWEEYCSNGHVILFPAVRVIRIICKEELSHA